MFCVKGWTCALGFGVCTAAPGEARGKLTKKASKGQFQVQGRCRLQLPRMIASFLVMLALRLSVSRNLPHDSHPTPYPIHTPSHTLSQPSATKSLARWAAIVKLQGPDLQTQAGIAERGRSLEGRVRHLASCVLRG